MPNFQYSSNGLDLTKQFEGIRLNAYQDSVGVWTVGYGHTGSDVVRGLTITAQQADILLAADVAWAVTAVNKAVQTVINQNQFDALVDFTFNLGAASFTGSTLLRLLNAGNFAGASAEFIRWNKAKKKVLAGLTRRRQAETDLFNTPPILRTGVSLKAFAAPETTKKATKKKTKKKSAKKAVKTTVKKAAKKKAAPKKSK
ncbi:MAG: lysozyme [Edaphobacter sp.]|uniref:lysozyme n=1 Tax=Edaphobacter sp. TaxID=1934404 RepID=UPI0023A0DA76|nr:lysozyme [Edaphobacter sp.]MDE1178523.1 lysozyme [Edaphobacter sp.]